MKKTLVWLSLHSSYSHSSLALPLIHAVCGDCGLEWHHLEFTAAEDPQEIICAIAGLEPDFLCVPLYIFNRTAALDIITRWHRLAPDCAIAVGGPECLGEGAEEIMRDYPFLKAVFRGEGEEMFAAFLAGQTGGILAAEDGIFHGWTEQAFPADDPFFSTEKAFVQYETSRGCPMGCLYCTSGNTKTRFKPLETVEKELTALRKRGVREIRILDRTFNLPQERCVRLLRLFRLSFPEIRFHLELHPQFLNETVRAELSFANPGQLHIEAGIQSLDPSVQKCIGRNSDTEKLADGLHFLCSCARLFETHADLLAGLPGQTFSRLIQDAETLMQIAPAEIQLEILKVLPGTPLRQQAEALGLTYAPAPPYDVMRTKDMTPQELLLTMKLSRLLDLTYNHPALHPVMLRLNGTLRDLFRFFLENGLTIHRLYDLKKRFLLMTEFLQTFPCPDAEFELAYQWLLAGYPPEQTPFCPPERCGAEETEHLPLCSGDAACLTEPETKLYKLNSKNRRTAAVTAFNRKYACNRPAAIWRER